MGIDASEISEILKSEIEGLNNEERFLKLEPY